MVKQFDEKVDRRTTTIAFAIPRHPFESDLDQSNHPNMPVSEKYTQDGQEAKEIAKYLPYFPFKGIPRFYDIGGFLYEPEIFQKIVDIFVERYRELQVDVIAG